MQRICRQIWRCSWMILSRSEMSRRLQVEVMRRSLVTLDRCRAPLRWERTRLGRIGRPRRPPRRASSTKAKKPRSSLHTALSRRDRLTVGRDKVLPRFLFPSLSPDSDGAGSFVLSRLTCLALRRGERRRSASINGSGQAACGLCLAHLDLCFLSSVTRQSHKHTYHTFSWRVT